MELLTGLLSSLGLSGAAGLNAYIPLLLVGLLSRAGVMHLSAPFDLLMNPWVLLGVAVLGALDFVGDKIPGVDHALHVVGGVVNAAAGAVLFASHAGVADVPPSLALVLGVIVAGGVHGARTAVRPVATATTAGLGNPVVSTVEDGTSLLMSVLAVFAPVLAVLLLAVIAVVGYRLWSRLGGRRRAL
ncbi:hypothetical protein HNQ07_003176 [Deinococcus metalli]|uniref:DUF4126 domain-containing protein n=1 Tax=Deinococcus metalli TaxID=1141878 RepID=A0A7W8NT00_9DEIO|nr:DUF4126 domain-containing protein [Deinococcus metalli]MBB5377677.1 hypothetical protein [Deinococcus metalli]GHF52490.1 hypothetical protein GCM10017781_31050 [Deinococcus metalli]